MTESHDKLQEKLHLLTESYAEELPIKISKIVQTWNQIQRKWNMQSLQALHRMAHNLVGSGKIHGYPTISDEARFIEIQLKELIQAGTPANEQQRNHMQSLIENFAQVLLYTRPEEDESFVAIKEHAPSPKTLRKTRQIYIVDDDHTISDELSHQLKYFGYDTLTFSRLDKFKLAMKKNPDAIFLMDMQLDERTLAGTEVISEIQKEGSTPLTVIFTSEYQDFDSRLGAVRAESVAYFTKPLNISKLVDKIDSLMSIDSEKPFHVILIDDDPSLLAYYSTVLEHAGMVVRTTNNPSEIITLLHNFPVDLIITDVYMNECSGMELSQIIRQFNSFIFTPIMYLSTEVDIKVQLRALEQGADDFLVKPVETWQLVSAITSRIQRSRLLISFMVRDSLTGLFNHSVTEEHLDREVARATREKTKLSFAMIDIDAFKKVNDTYGHGAGDLVIKSLAQLLKQRLRETDIIGRYGGEEFAVIMINTNSSNAMNMMEDIRANFAQLVHHSGDKEFSVTISCGVADISHFKEAIRLRDAADKALYEAKEKSRNLVVLAQG